MTQRKPEGGGNPETNAIDTRDFSSFKQADSAISRHARCRRVANALSLAFLRHLVLEHGFTARQRVKIGVA